MSDLSLTETHDLIDELLNRGTACVIAMSMPVDGDPSVDKVFSRRSGNFAAQIGLGHFICEEISSTMVFNQYTQLDDIEGVDSDPDGSE